MSFFLWYLQQRGSGFLFPLFEKDSILDIFLYKMYRTHVFVYTRAEIICIT